MMPRVDNIPRCLQPAFRAYGYTGAALMHVMFTAMRSAVTFDKCRNTTQHRPRIECVFHENIPAYMASYLPPKLNQPRHVWMNHPAWRMLPIHVWLEWNGVDELMLGSTGHGGQLALDKLINLMKTQQYSTMIAVDGPAGPPYEVKRGALDLAMDTGLPLVGISFKYDKYIRALGWDGKYYPLPFTIVEIRESEPIYVTRQS